MKISISLLTISLVSALAACSTTGNHYALPAQSVILHPDIQGSFSSAQGPGISSQAVPQKWWQLYHDDKLNHLIEQAFIANTDLRIAIANLHRALANESSVDAKSNPSASVSARMSRAQSSAESYLHSTPIPVANVGSGIFNIGYEVDLFGKLKNAQAAAKANSEASLAAADLVRITVAAETARAYMQHCSATRQMAVIQHSLQLQTQKVTAINRLVSAGKAPKSDLLPAQIQRDSIQAGLPNLQAEQTATRYRLASLLGKAPNELPESAVACTAEPQLSQLLPTGNGAELLKRRPDIREAERQLAAATANINVATAELYPSITFGASYGFVGLINHLGEDRTEQWSLGPLVSWTIPDSGARSRVKSAKADAEAALAKFDGTVLNALREVETALTIYTSDLQRNAALRSARKDAQQNVLDQRRLYASGSIPFLPTLAATQALTNLDETLSASEAQLAQDQVNLFLALGGGWEQTH